MADAVILVPTTPAELIDRRVILEIKAARVVDPEALMSVKRELDLLRSTEMVEIVSSPLLERAVTLLRHHNLLIWDSEDALSQATTDEEVARLARVIREANFDRARVKRAINRHLGSDVLEAKQYAGRT